MPGVSVVRWQQAGVLALGAAVAVVMVLLGLWQHDVYTAQGADVAAARAAAPPVPLSSVAVAGQEVGDGFGRTVTATGRYLPSRQLVIDGTDGHDRVLTALRLADGSVVAVVRGELANASADGSTPGSPPPGEQQLSGILLPSESDDDGPQQSAPDDGGRLSAVVLPVIAQRWPEPLVSGYVTLDATESRAQGLAPASAALPEGRGRLRNAAYALQWWVFAAFAVAMATKVARDLGRADDYRRLDEPADDGGAEPDGDAEPAVEADSLR